MCDGAGVVGHSRPVVPPMPASPPARERSPSVHSDAACSPSVRSPSVRSEAPSSPSASSSSKPGSLPMYSRLRPSPSPAPFAGRSAYHRSASRRSGSVLAPSGFSDSEADSDEPTPSFTVRAPSGLTDSDSSECDSAGEVDSRRRSAFLAGTADSRLCASGYRSGSVSGHRRRSVRALTPVEQALQDATAQMLDQLQIRAAQRVGEFEAALAEIDADEAAAVAGVEAERTQRRAAAQAEEDRARQQHSGHRAQLLSRLQREHSQKAQAGSRQLERVEATARKVAEEAAERRVQRQAQQEEQRRQQAEARAQQERQAQEQKERERQHQAQAQAAAEQGARQQQQQQQVAAHSAQPAALPQAQQQQQPSQATKPGQLKVCIAASAAEQEKLCAEQLAAAEAAVAGFRADDSLKPQRRALDKFVTLNVQQISATQDQVARKGAALAARLAEAQGPHRPHLFLQLAAKLVSQCEVQVQRLHAFAFPLAEVAVAVAAAHPDFLPLLLAKLHQACILAVPKYYLGSKSSSEGAYLRAIGYRDREAEGVAVAGQPAFESTDDFMNRMQGYVRFYAALTQSDNPRNPHGLQHAWTFLARLLNVLPADRVTATALDAFLRVAGYQLYRTYRAQFVKLLHYIDGVFIADLKKVKDPDVRAVTTRLHTYLHNNQFTQVPEGRDMPQYDASSYDRA